MKLCIAMCVYNYQICSNFGIGLSYLITIPDLFVGICYCQNCFAIQSHGFVTSIN